MHILLLLLYYYFLITANEGVILFVWRWNRIGIVDYSLGKSMSQPVVSSSSLSKLTGSASSVGGGGSGMTTGSDIERIMAKIEQDNRVLAELDKSRATISKSHNY